MLNTVERSVGDAVHGYLGWPSVWEGTVACGREQTKLLVI